MRVIVASTDRSATEWLEHVLRAAGVSVVVLSDPDPRAPELASSELLIADRESAAAVGSAGPQRRLLLVPRGEAVDLSQALSGGFMDLLVVPAAEDEVLARVGRALDHFLKPVSRGADAGQVQELKDIVERVTKALRASGPNSPRAVHELAEGMLSVFLLLVDSHEASERGTPGHSRRVGALVRRLASRLGRSDQEVAWLELAGRLHDIGLLALGLPLAGESALSLETRKLVEQHPKLSAEILKPLAAWGLPVGAIEAHHERMDGSGYPKRLEGEQISVDAQILGAADVYEALTSARPWRGPESPPDALQAMRTGGGFAPELLDLLEDVGDVQASPPGPLPQPEEGPP